MKNLTRVLDISLQHSEDIVDENKYQFDIVLSGVGISIIDDIPQEISYITLENINLKMIKYTSDKQSMELTIRNCQIDNQLWHTSEPILLSSVRRKPENFLTLSTVHSMEGNILHIHLISVLIRETNIKTDLPTLISFANFYDSIKSNVFDNSQNFTASDILSFEIETSDEKGMIYASTISINAIKLCIDYNSHETLDWDHIKKNTSASTIARTASKIQGLTNITGAPISFERIILEHIFSSQSDIINRITGRYFDELRSQLINFVFSAEMIGNPIGFANDLSNTAADYFDPDVGIVITPEDIILGTWDITRKSLFTGVFGSASKITGGLGNGISLLSFDDDYTQRRMTNKNKRAGNIFEGVGYGIAELSVGVFDGVKGIVEQPIRGAVEDGAEGLLQGIGRGLLGAVVKPTVGVFDLASRATEGLQNTTDVFSVNSKITRKRMPRHFPPSRILEPYSQKHAIGQHLFHSIGDGQFRNVAYFDHINELRHGNHVFFATTVIVYTDNSLNIIWEVQYDELVGVEIQKNGKYRVLLITHELQYPMNIKCKSKSQAEFIQYTIENIWDAWKTTDLLL
eukprot:TRINITY_DN3214_c0_g3_i1.p1 TRINITY_DN3214_c0_g3~~TRINITY_DN3214_c0_g3_i1.p1  ORF type:complete len:656 (-),score=134.32 TRINITY_DN3214_c0_g3_i1:92-1813(-)